MSLTKRILLGLLAHIPLLGIVVISLSDAWINDGRSADALMAGHIEDALPYLLSEVALAFVQMGIAIPFILHAVKNPRVGSAGKIAWPLLMVFIGSFADPIYFYLHIWDPPPSPTGAPPPHSSSAT